MTATGALPTPAQDAPEPERGYRPRRRDEEEHLGLEREEVEMVHDADGAGRITSPDPRWGWC